MKEKSEVLLESVGETIGLGLVCDIALLIIGPVLAVWEKARR